MRSRLVALWRAERPFKGSLIAAQYRSVRSCVVRGVLIHTVRWQWRQWQLQRHPERQHCDSPPADLEERLPEVGVLFRVVHNTVMQLHV